MKLSRLYHVIVTAIVNHIYLKWTLNYYEKRVIYFKSLLLFAELAIEQVFLFTYNN